MAPFVHEIRVPWGDVDLSTTIYYPRVFHYFETAIEEFFRARGVQYGKFSDSQGVMLARVAARTEFKAPIRFHDLLRISVEVARIGSKSVTFLCEAKRDSTLVARGTSTGVAVQVGGWKTVEIPHGLRTLLETARGGAGSPTVPPAASLLRSDAAAGEEERKPLLEPSANCHRWTYRIHAGDVDLARVIYYPTLFHLFEQSIEDLFLAMNAPYRARPPTQPRSHSATRAPGAEKRTLDVSLVFPRVSVRGEFLAPIRVGDLLTFEVGVPRIGRTSVTFASRAVGEGGTAVARAEVTAVTVDRAKWTAVPVPEGWKERARPFTGPAARTPRDSAQG